MEHAGDIIGGLFLTAFLVLTISLCLRGWLSDDEPDDLYGDGEP